MSFAKSLMTDKPIDQDYARQLADIIRDQVILPFVERLGVDHNFVVDKDGLGVLLNTIDNANTGKHDQVSLVKVWESIPEIGIIDNDDYATGGALYLKNVHYERELDEADNEIWPEWEDRELFYVNSNNASNDGPVEIQLTKRGRLHIPVDGVSISYDKVNGLSLISPVNNNDETLPNCNIYPQNVGTPKFVNGSYIGNGSAQTIGLVPEGYRLMLLTIKEASRTQPVVFRDGTCYSPSGVIYPKDPPIKYYDAGDDDFNSRVVVLGSAYSEYRNHVNQFEVAYQYEALCIPEGV